MAVIMLNAVKLSDQWSAIERVLPPDWSEVRVRIRAEQSGEAGQVARVLGPMGAGWVGDELAVTIRRAGGEAGPEAAHRLFGMLDEARVWCELEQRDVTSRPAPTGSRAGGRSLAETWDGALATLPPDWSDLLCELEVDSSDYLDRVALLCAPVNPTRDGDRLAFTFRCARLAGYGASPSMARRCFERCDAEALTGSVSVLRVLSETDNVGTQGTVWLVGGKAL